MVFGIWVPYCRSTRSVLSFGKGELDALMWCYTVGLASLITVGVRDDAVSCFTSIMSVACSLTTFTSLKHWMCTAIRNAHSLQIGLSELSQCWGA